MMGGMSEHGIFAYDLEPPAARLPHVEPMRHPGQPSTRPRWVPPPLPDGFARVEVEDDYYTGPEFSDWTGEETEHPGRVFDIPREQYERWKAAREQYAAMQEEITALREKWLHGPGCALAGWVRKDKPYQVQP